jgi:hypothetical protein
LAGLGVKFTGEIALTPVPGPSERELEVLRAIVDESKKVGVMVQVHAVSTSAMVAAVQAGAPLLVHLPNKDWTSKEDAKKVADAGVKVLGTVGFGSPVFGVFAEDNNARFRDGKQWPQGIVDGVRLGEEAGYMPVNARTIWDSGAILARPAGSSAPAATRVRVYAPTTSRSPTARRRGCASSPTRCAPISTRRAA